MTDIERNENESFASVNGAENIQEDKTEKMFTQSQLEEIISERLSRERKVNESLKSVKTLLKSAADKGIIKGNSYSEMAKELVERLKGKSQDEAAECIEASTLKEASARRDAKTGGDAETILGKREIYSAGADAEVQNDVMCMDGDKNDKEENHEEYVDESFVSMICDIKSRYPKAEIEKLLTGDLFERFTKGRSGNIRDIVDDFFSFVSCFGTKDEQSEKSGGYSNFTSTAFSSQSGAATNGGANLTKQQMEIAKSAGMSYREYANLLQAIPKRAAKNI